ncbi:sugar kinase [Cognatiyoonia sp. IB215446]|uniref:sugar kinase n=1 Tax=Cognatiyoonia sp. IB215446 TaxID=3097355 RepID=UPI002A143526|nr:sugar kinase [Cognatiyoonia sp. IB215446]MDX8349301.1 sugar kinase [Cognatiyoonia sp. IB215446]
MRFLAIGECMAEMAPTDRDGDYRLGFAGDTFNTTWYLARTASDVQLLYLTAIGDDALSQQMRSFMCESGIDDQFVQVAQGRTVGLYLISLNHGERSFSYWRGQSAAKTLADDSTKLDIAMAFADLIYFSGITLAILTPDRRDVLLNALRAARSNGKTVAFDPNLRPKLWSTETEMTDTIMQGAAVSDILLPSFEDEATWFNDADPQATAERYRAVGAKTVIVKNGADPVHYVDGEASGQIAFAPVDTVVDTTAAGDSFNAGVFGRYAAGEDIAASITYGCTLSRAVIMQRGALVPVEPASLETANYMQARSDA